MSKSVRGKEKNKNKKFKKKWQESPWGSKGIAKRARRQKF